MYKLHYKYFSNDTALIFLGYLYHYVQNYITGKKLNLAIFMQKIVLII